MTPTSNTLKMYYIFKVTWKFDIRIGIEDAQMLKLTMQILVFLIALFSLGCTSNNGQKWPVVGPAPYVYSCPDEEDCFLDGRNYYPYYPSRTIYYPRGNEEPN